MSENLHDLLESDDPVALRRIEKALNSGDERNETVDAIISALIWRRCTAGQNGVLGAILHHECAVRIGVLPDHLDLVGATDAAQAVRDLRKEIPLEDKVIQAGIIGWVDVNPKITSRAAALSDRIDDIAPAVWSFMQKQQGELPDLAIPEKRKGLFAMLFG